MSNRRIAIAGLQHETNTFAPSYAGIAEFRKADSWPGLLRGQEVVDNTRGMNLPVAGAGFRVNLKIYPITTYALESDWAPLVQPVRGLEA